MPSSGAKIVVAVSCSWSFFQAEDGIRDIGVTGVQTLLFRSLMRSRADKKIGGVCAGLAHYLDLDVSLVRILWFFITLACGIFPGVVAYVLGWIIIPEEPLLLPVTTSQQPLPTDR